VVHGADLGADASELRHHLAMSGGQDHDGYLTVEALALDAFLERQTFKFICPCLEGIGSNMYCHWSLPLRPFCMNVG
jgi:hypothetical protein